ncbi:MAG: hypothetical protein QGH51_09680 [Planctomycetota bacterium]|nr:hypothetical protein [Planctomycetota bacterium]MDP6942280.1 hypothetical protein [Planctomycetota bacterium]
MKNHFQLYFLPGLLGAATLFILALGWVQVIQTMELAPVAGSLP